MFKMEYSRVYPIFPTLLLFFNPQLESITFEGYCDTELFNAWFEQFLTPMLQPEQTVILDNASFHKSKKISELAKRVDAEIFYLLPYSPDFIALLTIEEMIKKKLLYAAGIQHSLNPYLIIFGLFRKGLYYVEMPSKVAPSRSSLRSYKCSPIDK